MARLTKLSAVVRDGAVDVLRSGFGRWAFGVISFVVPLVWLTGIAGAVTTTTTTTTAPTTTTTTTVLHAATSTAKSTTLKYIGIALVGVVVVLALMIGIHVLIRLFRRAAK